MGWTEFSELLNQSTSSSSSSSLPSNGTLFTKNSSLYKRFRPHYSPEFFEYLSSLVCGETEPRLAWDVATGNGQVAIGLSPHFHRIIATDISSQQIKNAIPAENVEYYVLDAHADPKKENHPIEHHSIDLMTVGAAIHWLDHARFFQTVKMALKKPGGVIAVFGYMNAQVSPDIDEVIKSAFRFLLENGYVKSDIKVALNEYEDIVFPFEEVQFPKDEFKIKCHWNAEELWGWMCTWSATQIAIDSLGRNPLLDFKPALLKAWFEPNLVRIVEFRIYAKIGRISDGS